MDCLVGGKEEHMDGLNLCARIGEPVRFLIAALCRVRRACCTNIFGRSPVHDELGFGPTEARKVKELSLRGTVKTVCP